MDIAIIMGLDQCQIHPLGKRQGLSKYLSASNHEGFNFTGFHCRQNGRIERWADLAAWRMIPVLVCDDDTLAAW